MYCNKHKHKKYKIPYSVARVDSFYLKKNTKKKKPLLCFVLAAKLRDGVTFLVLLILDVCLHLMPQ
jgi:hypothetical protein